MATGRVKHVFPGGNTSLGFYSFYDQIIDPFEAERKIIIKGGPGTGKSTFMKKIGRELQDMGYDIEYLHCSSDNNSLDGIMAPQLGFAVIDGTAPHVVDPSYPGAVDEIINFGEFWSRESIKVHKADIMKTTKTIGELFSRGYRFLKAASYIYEGSAAIYSKALKAEKLNSFTSGLTDELFGNDEAAPEKTGRLRKLFASAITPNGLCNYLDSILTSKLVYEIKGDIGTCEGQLLEKVKNVAMERGFFVEAYYCALNPGKLEHIVIPGIDTAITTSNMYHSSLVAKYKTICMQDFMDVSILGEHSADLSEDRECIGSLLDTAILTISKAKALHDDLETYYIPNMNFGAVQICCDNLIAEASGQKRDLPYEP